MRTVYPYTGIGSSAFSTRSVYNAFGYLKEIRVWLDADTGRPLSALQGRVYWMADGYDVAGRINGETYGNGLANDRYYSETTGRLLRATIDKGSVLVSPFKVQDLNYSYDRVGNVNRRFDDATGREELFYNGTPGDSYDGLDRLKIHRITGGATVSIAYNQLGNITSKSDVGTYTYGGAGPHAVTSAGAQSYQYDVNGNMVTGGGRTIEWTSFNQLRKVTDNASNKNSEFFFGASRERVKQVRKTGSTLIDTTIYAGGLYEKITPASGPVEHKHYIVAPTGRIAVFTDRSDWSNDLRYFHTDGLGSVTVVSDEKGAVLKRFAYDAWGRQSTLANTTPFTATPVISQTALGGFTRGFTDHEMLADQGLIHMNGRVYDPVLGRFLSADPNIDGAEDAQGYNRYTYVGNNPLSFTDPTGHLKFWKEILGPIVQYVVAYYFGPWASAAVGATINGGKGAIQGFAAGIGGGLYGRVGYAFASGFSGSLLNGGSVGDAFKSGVIGGAQAYFAGRIGSHFDQGAGFWNEAGRAVAHGALGGLVEEAHGGQFRHGFYAGAVGSAAGSIAGTYIQGNEHWKFAARTTIAAVAGGTASVLGGGKFANGALTAAFQHMFNHESGYWAEVLETLQGYSFGVISEATYDPTSGAASGSESMDAGMAAGRWTVRLLTAPKSLLKGLFTGGLKMAVRSGGDDALRAAEKLAVNNADDAARLAKGARKINPGEVKALGGDIHAAKKLILKDAQLRTQLHGENFDILIDKAGNTVLKTNQTGRLIPTGVSPSAFNPNG